MTLDQFCIRYEISTLDIANEFRISERALASLDRQGCLISQNQVEMTIGLYKEVHSKPFDLVGCIPEVDLILEEKSPTNPEPDRLGRHVQRNKNDR